MRHLFYIISQQKCKINIYKPFFDCNVILLKKEDIIQKICPLCIKYAYYFVIITFCMYLFCHNATPPYIIFSIAFLNNFRYLFYQSPSEIFVV